MLTAILYITGLPPYRSEKYAIGGESVLPLDEGSLYAYVFERFDNYTV